TVEIATELMDQKIHTFAERESASKRKFKSTSRNTQNQQQNKRQNTGRAYTATSGAQQIPTMLTFRGPLGWARNLFASSVEFMDILRGNVQS
ncbi:hypothetical protein Tco_0346069, partial [Tanacetum coccineum]